MTIAPVLVVVAAAAAAAVAAVAAPCDSIYFSEVKQKNLNAAFSDLQIREMSPFSWIEKMYLMLFFRNVIKAFGTDASCLLTCLQYKEYLIGVRWWSCGFH